MQDTLEICIECGHATDGPPSDGRCRDCNTMGSYDNIEVCGKCYNYVYNGDDLCEDCLFMWKRAIGMGATKGRSLVIREAAQRKDLANV